MERVAAIVAVLMLAACGSTEVRYAPARCQEAEEPSFGPVEPVRSCEGTGPETECLTDETWSRIKDRTVDLREYASKLQSSCDTFDRLATEAENDAD